MDSLVNSLEQFFASQGCEQIFWIAYSGGLDSQVLLHAAASLRSKFPLKLRAIYINHGLSPHASAWAEHCANVCNHLKIDFLQQEIHIQNTNGLSPESVAREYRYEIFSKILGDKDYLLTAHHQNDQAETVLLQLMRGAGLKGLAAMPIIKPFAKGFHARPLLCFSREDLRKYAQQHQLCWIEDESNANTQFTRNFLRHEVLPFLEKRWPSVVTTLSRVADHCAESQAFIDKMIAEKLIAVQGSVPGTLSVYKLLQSDATLQKYILRAWILQQGFQLPSRVKLEHVIKDILQSRSDKTPCVKWSGVEVRRYLDDVYVMSPLQQHDNAKTYHWNLDEILQILHVGALSANILVGEGLLRADVRTVTVKFRQGGEVCQLPGRHCHHSLKKLFQQWKVPSWLRDRIPLIYVDEQLAAIPGYFIAKEFMTHKHQSGWKLTSLWNIMQQSQHRRDQSLHQFPSGCHSREGGKLF